jgi:hypothetical protein
MARLGGSDNDPATQLALTVLIMAMIAACLGGCSLAYPPGDRLGAAERPHPTPAALAVLLDAPVKSEHVEAPFTLKLSAPIIMAGGATWLACYVPTSYGPGRMAIGFDGTGLYSERAIEHVERKALIERIPCGTWVASCTIRTARGLERREQKLESRGECNGVG